MIRHEFGCGCWHCQQFREWLEQQFREGKLGLTEKDFEHIKIQTDKIKSLENQILDLLKVKDRTIPDIVEELNLDNDYIVMKIIGNLEYEKKVKLKNFKLLYREDGGAIHLAVYDLVNNDEDKDNA